MSKALGYTVHLLRVGKTSWDEDQRLIGETELPMTEAGSDAVARALRTFKPDTPLSLVLVSQEEGTHTVGKLIAGSDTRIRTIADLSNVGLGLWEGVLRTDLEERCPSAYAQWKDSPERITPPEGESFQDARYRLVSAIVRAMKKAKGPHPHIAIVLRPWAWAIVRCWLRGADLGEIWKQLDEPVCVETFEVMRSYLEQADTLPRRKTKAAV